MSIIGKIIIAVLISALCLWALPAFPGAEGWGAEATGGRGGQVIHVTNTNAYGPGSFAAALGGTTSKIIVFDVGGVINLNNAPLMIRSNTTVAGQTAPGGITLVNGGLYTQYQGTTRNMIVRFIRVRRSADAADGDCLRFISCDTYIADHCSGFWCSDEILDITHCYNGTVQYTILAEPGQCYEQYGSGSGNGNNRTGVLGAPSDGRITLYKCLLAHQMKRSPFLSNRNTTSPLNQTYEFINNVVYDCRPGSQESFDEGNTIPLNLIGNYYKNGPSAAYPSSMPYAHSGTVPPAMKVYAAGNHNAQFPTLSVPQGFFNPLSVNGFEAAVIQPVKTVNIAAAQDAYADVMAGAGVFPRDSADRRVIKETQDGTGKWVDVCDVTPDPYYPGSTAKPQDTDNDGMPDSWETTNGLNPNNPSDYSTSMNGGYMAIEVYVNELADQMAPTPKTDRSFVNTIDGAPRVTAEPNPFYAGVRFALLNFGRTPVLMSVHDIGGRTVFKSRLAAGARELVWDGRSQNGRALAAGVYIARFAQKNRVFQKRISLIR